MVVILLAAFWTARRQSTAPDRAAAAAAAAANAWILESVKFYRPLDFFPQFDEASDDAVAEAVAEMLRNNWGDDFSPAHPHAELMLLEAAPTRVWWADTEAGVAPGSRVYEQVFDEWARVSLGVFQPENVTETWETPGGPIIVTFTLGDRNYTLIPDNRGDWLDLRILGNINGMIIDSGRQFVAHFAGQSAVVMCLTDSERRSLERNRRWTFDPDI